MGKAMHEHEPTPRPALLELLPSSWIAKQLGISQNTVCVRRYRKSAWPAGDVDALADLLGVSVVALTGAGRIEVKP